MLRRVILSVGMVVLASLLPQLRFAAEQPLTQDDVMLLLLGGAANEKMFSLIEHRGVSFRMTPDLAKKFHDAGANDAVIEALQKAGEKVQAVTPSTTSSVNTGPPPAKPPGKDETSSPKSGSGAEPKDPGSEEVQRIIQEFAAKEKLFKAARDNYAYHQINKVQQLDVDGNAVGAFEQDWDILYDDSGKRVERVTYAPPDTLKGLLVTAEDLNSMRNIQPFVLTTEELPDYDVKYLGHTRVDEVTCYVFSIRPREIRKGRQYFQGVVWVDDRDLQIVKSEGKPVPEMRTKKGEMNLFPRFTTFREQIDGKFWFPTYTMADDTLYFPSGPIRIKEVIKYTDYKQFKASSTIRVLTEVPSKESKDATKGASSKDTPPK